MSDPRVAIYARQSVAEDQGIRQQLDDCRSEASRRGWVVSTEFVDNDTSGSSLRGPKTHTGPDAALADELKNAGIPYVVWLP